jgi:hypothetical protein
VPIELKQASIARGFRHGGEIPERYWRLSTLWAIFGAVATILPFVNIFLMVFKPD